MKTTNNTNNVNGSIELTLEERFDIYIEESPEVYEAFKTFAHAAKAKGFKKYSAAALFQIIRWESGASGSDSFKINNTYHPYFARKLMAEDRSFEGFFELRRVKSDVRLEDNINYELR